MNGPDQCRLWIAEAGTAIPAAFGDPIPAGYADAGRVRLDVDHVDALVDWDALDAGALPAPTCVRCPKCGYPLDGSEPHPDAGTTR